jgi:hypothetical protein
MYAPGDDYLVTVGVYLCYIGFQQAFNVPVMETLRVCPQFGRYHLFGQHEVGRHGKNFFQFGLAYFQPGHLFVQFRKIGRSIQNGLGSVGKLALYLRELLPFVLNALTLLICIENLFGHCVKVTPGEVFPQPGDDRRFQFVGVEVLRGAGVVEAIK